ncbi:uncharacterized protein LOC132711220 [Pantherophis guttatus]|uniref:Uncharacterized protein LOC132711220 n=1 Tax=Pantherophis guttatus TaxID=94885 RepID=A0ABM3ZB34_PANGU|nr:uncharacterized protein LOC132711220 [Pantherophis guttatus]
MVICNQEIQPGRRAETCRLEKYKARGGRGRKRSAKSTEWRLSLPRGARPAPRALRSLSPSRQKQTLDHPPKPPSLARSSFAHLPGREGRAGAGEEAVEGSNGWPNRRPAPDFPPPLRLLSFSTGSRLAEVGEESLPPHTRAAQDGRGGKARRAHAPTILLSWNSACWKKKKKRAGADRSISNASVERPKIEGENNTILSVFEEFRWNRLPSLLAIWSPWVAPGARRWQTDATCCVKASKGAAANVKPVSQLPFTAGAFPR